MKYLLKQEQYFTINYKKWHAFIGKHATTDVVISQ